MLTHPDHTRAEKSAILRAASKLESSGRVKLTSLRVAGGQPRLVAYPADADVHFRRVFGIDGKTYRLPA